MDTLTEQQCSALPIDHLGLVADKIEDLGIIKLIDERLPLTEGCGAKTSMGERVATMIFNGLGFVDSRLYVFPEFLSKRPVSRLFGKPMEAAWFNDDALGRCLDRIADYGTTKLFTEMSFIIGTRKKLLGRSAHFDTSTLQTYGEYDVDEEVIEEQDIPLPARGYSKSHRHDLKQMVINLATTGKAAFPVWMESHSGNESDKKILPDAAKRMNDLCQQLSEVEDFIYVGDSAIYSNILAHSDQMKWLTRVPNNLLLAKHLLLREEADLDWQDLGDGYQYHASRSGYGGVDQRWILVYSQTAYRREVTTLERRISKEYDTLEKQWWHLSNQYFNCEQDARVAANALATKMKYHQVDCQVIERVSYEKAGRPRAGAKPVKKGYQLEVSLRADTEAIELAKRKTGRFILSTNELDTSKLPDDEILKEYKAQSGTEQGFKFIKDNTFQVDSLFLKSPKRIDALMMVMTLCLMVYGVSQYELRQSLQALDEFVPNQRRKPTQKPSMKWVYFLFLSVQELKVSLSDRIQTLVVNVNGLLKRIVNHFGPRARAVYFNSS